MARVLDFNAYLPHSTLEGAGREIGEVQRRLAVLDHAKNSQKTIDLSQWMSTEKQRFFWDAGKVVAFPCEWHALLFLHPKNAWSGNRFFFKPHLLRRGKTVSRIFMMLMAMLLTSSQKFHCMEETAWKPLC